MAPSARSSRCCEHGTAAMRVPRCGQVSANLRTAQRRSQRQCAAVPGQQQQQQQAHVSWGPAGSGACSWRSISCRQTSRPCRRRQLITCRAATATLMRGDDDDDQQSSSTLTGSSPAGHRPDLSEAPSQDGEHTASSTASEAEKADEPLRSRTNTAMIALRCAVRISVSSHDAAHNLLDEDIQALRNTSGGD